MSYITDKQIDKAQPIGSLNNPIFRNDYLEREEKRGHKLVAEYLGFKLKWDVHVDYKCCVALINSCGNTS